MMIQSWRAGEHAGNILKYCCLKTERPNVIMQVVLRAKTEQHQKIYHELIYIGIVICGRYCMLFEVVVITELANTEELLLGEIHI